LKNNERAAALTTYLVGEIERYYPARPIGRSLLQKLLYILSRNGNFEASFDLYFNGPYSDTVESAICQAEESGMLTVYKENGRSCISARGGISGDVSPELKVRSSQCVLAYGFYEEMDLAILTTALYMERHFHGLDELIKAVFEVNPRFDMRRVCSLIDHSDVVYRSW
jgi:hypothetical protein